MHEIPKIIHQVWSGIHEPLPEHFQLLGETWREHHPDWEYILWDNEQINSFIIEYYPWHWDVYQSYRYDVQRWDAIRYVILEKIGGMYVDFDIECIKPHDPLLVGKTCCFSAEPPTHQVPFEKDYDFNNALMACVPGHPFMKKIIDKVFSYLPQESEDFQNRRFYEVLTTTGPWALVDLYEKYSNKDEIYLIPAKYVSPYDKKECRQIRQGHESEEFDNRLKEAYSVHYFFGNWLL